MNCAHSPTYDCFRENKTEKKKAKKGKKRKVGVCLDAYEPVRFKLGTLIATITLVSFVPLAITVPVAVRLTSQ